MRDTTDGGWTKEDSSNDLGDDFGLFDIAESPAEALGEDDDDAELDDEEDNGLA